MAAPDELRYDRHGDVISEAHDYGVKSASELLVSRLRVLGVQSLHDVEMDVYEGPPGFRSGH